MNSVLVTGANGQLGKTIRELYSHNHMEYGFTFVTKSELDITDEKIVKSFFKQNQFDYCINCAAYTNVEQAEKTPDIAYKINAEAVKYLAEACLETQTILIHISTDYVFDGEKKEPYTVEDLPNPINEYGRSKLLGEKHIQNTLQNFFIIRTSWLYSKKHGKNFYKTILEKAQTQKEIFVTDKQIGCPTDTVNLSQYILNLIKSKDMDFGLYHFCGDKVMTWFDFAEQILIENNQLKYTKLIRKNNHVVIAKRPVNSVLI